MNELIKYNSKFFLCAKHRSFLRYSYGAGVRQRVKNEHSWLLALALDYYDEQQGNLFLLCFPLF